MSPEALTWGWGTCGTLLCCPSCTPPPLTGPHFPTEPHFVASVYIPESVGSFTGDDDKIYFFFSERAVEYDCYAEQVVARVARICKVVLGPSSVGGVWRGIGVSSLEGPAALTSLISLPLARVTWGAHGPCRRSGPPS